ncbi:MAG: EAL domain-containing protein [Polyangiaceae bacterium]
MDGASPADRPTPVVALPAPPPARSPAPAPALLDDIDLEDLLAEPPARPSALHRRDSIPAARRDSTPARRDSIPAARRDYVPTPPSGTVLRIPSPGARSEIVTVVESRPAPAPSSAPPGGLAASLARLGIAVLETDAAGRIVRMNEAAERLTQRTLADAPFTADDLLHIGDPPSRPDAADASLEEPDDATAWLLRPSADPLAIRHVVVPREGAPGSLLLLREAQAGAVYAPTIARRARYDPLTGLFNRRGISEQIDRAVQSSRQSVRDTAEERRHALCYIDLDRFSLVNSTCGHDAGDDLLQWVATRLSEAMDGNDDAARIAGDEFAILLPDHDARDAERKAREIQRRLGEFRFAWGHKTFLIETSLGLFPFGGDPEDADAVLASAAHACRVAKKNGGARIQIYLDDDDQMAQSRRSMEWVAGIQHHLAEGKLQLYAQPIQPIRARKDAAPGHFEILMRVIDEAGRPTSPVGIIQAAENGRVMDSIDRFIVRKAFQTIGALSRRAMRRLELFSVNLSAISLGREGLLDYIVEQLERSAVPPGKVCFEITETAALNNLDEVRWLIQELGAMGCRFAIDDFGSGHASYGYIERLPVDYVKIDGMFVRDMMTNALHRAIVESVNRIATTLGIKTIAECVETEDAAEVLAGMGVHYGQGWYYARPAPIGEICKSLDAD